ncbi:hypothetical protein NDU88_001942 [Pleurodeles waltl]|uniref:Uncharacterized protein n=1 Tax=Pleurodeles waltl TaxID=8319 RepID=A0AAV7MMC2_PLEWA|nr:hypothetical protein NDU88_001942 [Pleurodeles waltl]
MPLWGRKKSEAESRRQHGAEARSIPGWLATDPFSCVAGVLNRWAAPVVWEALDEKVTPLLVEDAIESVKLRGAKLELKAAGQVGWLFLSAVCTVYRKTLTQDAEIIKLRDEVAALQERQLLMKETTESAVTRGDQMEARCTALAVRVAKQKSRQKPKMPSTVQVRALIRKQKSRQKPKMPSTVQVRALIRKQESRQKPKIPLTVQVRALVRKENWDPHTWEDEVEVRVTELGGVESGEGRVGEIEGEKGANGGQIQNSCLVRDYTQSELLQRTRMLRQMPAEPLFKWLVRLWDTGAKDALQNTFTLGPITEGDPFELEMIVQDDVDDVVMWSLWQRQEKKRMPQDWALVEIERKTDDRPRPRRGFGHDWPLLAQQQQRKDGPDVGIRSGQREEEIKEFAPLPVSCVILLWGASKTRQLGTSEDSPTTTISLHRSKYPLPPAIHMTKTHSLRLSKRPHMPLVTRPHLKNYAISTDGPCMCVKAPEFILRVVLNTGKILRDRTITGGHL